MEKSKAKLIQKEGNRGYFVVNELQRVMLHFMGDGFQERSVNRDNFIVIKAIIVEDELVKSSMGQNVELVLWIGDIEHQNGQGLDDLLNDFPLGFPLKQKEKQFQVVPLTKESEAKLGLESFRSQLKYSKNFGSFFSPQTTNSENNLIRFTKWREVSWTISIEREQISAWIFLVKIKENEWKSIVRNKMKNTR